MTIQAVIAFYHDLPMWFIAVGFAWYLIYGILNGFTYSVGEVIEFVCMVFFWPLWLPMKLAMYIRYTLKKAGVI